MARYGKEFRQRAVARLLPPESSSVTQVATELGVHPIPCSAGVPRWRGVSLLNAGTIGLKWIGSLTVMDFSKALRVLDQ